MNWYLQSNENSDVAISTKVVLSRNLKGIKFNIENKEEYKKLEDKIKDNIYAIGYGLKYYSLRELDKRKKDILYEKKLISYKFANNLIGIGGILLNDEENICIMIGEDEHIKIQVFDCGLQLESTLELATEIDKKMEQIFGFCVNQKYGYLTSSLENIGTGLNAMVELHLVALEKTGNVKKVLKMATDFGFSVSRYYDEESNAYSDYYQIENERTLGITEKNIIKSVKLVAEKIIEQEREARRKLTEEPFRIQLEDLVYTNYGILKYARVVSEAYARKLLSNIKLGVDLGILQELSDLQVNKMMLYYQDANMQKYLGKEINKKDLDIERANLLRMIIENENK